MCYNKYIKDKDSPKNQKGNHMLEITIENTLETRELSNAYAKLKKLYNERRDEEIRGIIKFLRENPDSAFTAAELSSATGLSTNTIGQALSIRSSIGKRDRERSETYALVKPNGEVDMNITKTVTTKTREYFWNPRR